MVANEDVYSVSDYEILQEIVQGQAMKMNWIGVCVCDVRELWEKLIYLLESLH